MLGSVSGTRDITVNKTGEKKKSTLMESAF